MTPPPALLCLRTVPTCTLAVASCQFTVFNMRTSTRLVASLMFLYAAGQGLSAAPCPEDSIIIPLSDLDLRRPELADIKELLAEGNADAAAEAWLRHCRHRTVPRWYWDHDETERIAEFLKSNMSEACDEALNDAAFVMKHQFPHSCAPTVVQRVQLKPGFSFMDNPTGDRQFLYMLHRHRFWEELAIAFILTGDHEYAREWASQLDRWLAELPLPVSDVNVRKHDMWYGLDAGIRAYSWPWAYHAFLKSGVMTPERHALWLEHFVEHASFLRQHHAPPSSNWCTMQMYGLLSVALTFPELEQAEGWRDYAVKKLEEAIKLQVLPDGVHVEQSPSYHVGCVGWFAEPMRLGQLNGIRWSEGYRTRLEHMAEFTLWIMDPAGLLPALSDTDRSDRGQVALAHGALLFERKDFAARALLPLREALVYGQDAVTRFMSISHSLPSERLRVFPEAGYAILRSDWTPLGSFTVFDCGPRGHGHGHFDLLNVEIHAGGELLIADPGRWWYDDSDLRREMVSTPAHNTISIDGRNHAPVEISTPDRYELFVSERIGGWHHLAGRHHAYAELEGKPVCERHIFTDGIRTWIFVDEVRSDSPHDVMVSFQFATTDVRQARPGQMVIEMANGPEALLIHEAREDLAVSIEPATLSRVYGQREPAHRCRLRRHGSHVLILTALQVGSALGSAGIVSEYTEGETERYTIQFPDHSIRLHRSPDRSWHLDPQVPHGTKPAR